MPAGTQCKACQKTEFKKGQDILDVWFDSGVQHSVYVKKRGMSFPANVFLEGSDQHRGWFQTSLLTSLALNSSPPFKTLLTHGFVNDEKGYKMSKSKNNNLAPSEIIKHSGAEILRLWVASENSSLDLKAGQQSFLRVTESYRRFRNTFRFILGNLKDFDFKKDLIPYSQLNRVDAWALGQLNLLIKNSTQAYEEFAFHKVYQQLNYFFTVRLSAFYLDIIKDRLYTFAPKSPERRKAQTLLFHLINELLPLMSPITSFLCEEAYSYLPKAKKQSVFLEDFPLVKKEWQNKELEDFFVKLFSLRDQLNKQLESLRAEGKIGSNLEARAQITLKKDFISPVLTQQESLEFFSVSQLVIKEGEEANLVVDLAKGDKCLRCWFMSESLNTQKMCVKCEEQLKN